MCDVCDAVPVNGDLQPCYTSVPFASDVCSTYASKARKLGRICLYGKRGRKLLPRSTCQILALLGSVERVCIDVRMCHNHSIGGCCVRLHDSHCVAQTDVCFEHAR